MGPENLVNIEIDGVKIRVAKGTTVLQAARMLDIEIPTLCYHEALSPQASCRICIVELSVEKRGRVYDWVDASCVYPVEEGLRVQTNSEKVIKERKLILELLLSRAPDSAVLKDMAVKYGVKSGRFETLDQGKSNCILCGLCVRACNELVQSGAIGMANRGVRKCVVTPFNIANELCIGCTACASVCPTGAIKVRREKEFLNVDLFGVSIQNELCIDCGEQIAPVIQVEQVTARVGIRENLLNRCPECRRKVFSNTRLRG